MAAGQAEFLPEGAVPLEALAAGDIASLLAGAPAPPYEATLKDPHTGRMGGQPAGQTHLLGPQAPQQAGCASAREGIEWNHLGCSSPAPT